jgi:hypothetical protein
MLPDDVCREKAVGGEDKLLKATAGRRNRARNRVRNRAGNMDRKMVVKGNPRFWHILILLLNIPISVKNLF